MCIYISFHTFNVPLKFFEVPTQAHDTAPNSAEEIARNVAALKTRVRGRGIGGRGGRGGRRGKGAGDSATECLLSSSTQFSVPDKVFTAQTVRSL